MSKCKLIMALDLPDKKSFVRWVDKTKDLVSFYKVGLQIYTKIGPDAVNIIKKRGKNVFLDLKFFDIPNTVASAINSGVSLDVDMIDLHLLAGKDNLLQIIRAVKPILKKRRTKLIGITLLTSAKAGNRIKNKVIELSELAKEVGLDGVVCSGQEASVVRHKCGGKFIIICPGIRIDSNVGDQKRIATPEEVSKFADYVVVGRPILTAKNPLSVIEDINNRLSS